MGIKKLVKQLQEQLSKGKKKKLASCDEIDALLLELGIKEKKLQQKLAKEDDSSKRKDIKLKLKIAQLQLKKGKAKRAEIAKKIK